MKHLLAISILLILLISSCKTQDKTNETQSTKTQTPSLPPILAELQDRDPYFVESTAVSSPNGPKSITRNILQDRQGNIWLAAWEGIIRYDGKTFTNFTNKEGLRRFHVFSLLEDSKGNIWFGTIGAGVYKYDGQTFTNFTIKEGLVYDGIGCIYEDQKGNIWFGTQGGISIYDGQDFKNFTTQNGLPDNDINSIIQDKNGIFWFGSRGKAFTYNGQYFKVVARKHGSLFYNVRSIIRDQNDQIWLGGNDGLWRYQPNKQQGIWTNLYPNFVGYIYEDRQGNIWTSSQGTDGWDWVLSRFDKRPLPYEFPTATSILAKPEMFFGITEDKEGGIWLGTVKGVTHYDGKTFNSFQEKVN